MTYGVDELNAVLDILYHGADRLKFLSRLVYLDRYEYEAIESMVNLIILGLEKE